jgi:hypothetical protein
MSPFWNLRPTTSRTLSNEPMPTINDAERHARDLETPVPTEAWATVRFFRVLPVVLGWKTASAIAIPMQLERYQCGIVTAPHLWRPKPNLLDALLDPTVGLTQSSIDPGVFLAPSPVIVKVGEQLGVAALTEAPFDAVIKKMKANRLSVPDRSSNFLESNSSTAPKDPSSLRKNRLIRKIIAASSLESCMPRSTPAVLRFSSPDEYGAPNNASWRQSFVLDMLQRVADSTRPDIAFAVSQQGARLSANPTTSDAYAYAVKRIGRSLVGTAD